MDSIRFLIEFTKSSLEDSKSAEYLELARANSLLLSNDDFIKIDTDELLMPVFDKIQTLTQNINNKIKRKQSILVLKSLIEIIVNYMSNSVYFSRKLIEINLNINKLIQFNVETLFLLESNDPDYSELVDLMHTAFDLIFSYLDLRENYRFDTNTIEILKKIKEKISPNESFKLIVEKLDYYVINLKSPFALNDERNKEILSKKYHSVVKFLKEQKNSNEIFNNQTALNSIKYLKIYSKLDPSSFDKSLLDVLLKILKAEISKTTPNKYSIDLIISILFNYATRNYEFVSEFQYYKNSFDLLFESLNCCIQSKVHDAFKIEKLLKLIYHLVKKLNHLRQHNWPNSVQIILKLLDYHARLDRNSFNCIIRTIALIHDYSDQSDEPIELIYNEYTIPEWLHKFKIDSSILNDTKFRNVIICLHEKTYYNLLKFESYEQSRLIILEFLKEFIQYSFDLILNASNQVENILDVIKLHGLLCLILDVCSKLCHNSDTFSTQFKPITYHLFIDFINRFLSLENKQNSLNNSLADHLARQILEFIHVLYLNGRMSMIYNKNSFEFIETLIHNSTSYSGATIFSLLNIVSDQFSQNQDADDSAQFFTFEPEIQLNLVEKFFTTYTPTSDLNEFISKRKYSNFVKFIDRSKSAFENFESETKTKFIEFLLNYFEVSLTLLENFSPEISQVNESSIMAIKCFKLLLDLAIILAEITEKSVDIVCTKYHEASVNSISNLLKLISKLSYDFSIDCKLSKIFKLLFNMIIKNILTSLLNLSRIEYKFKKLWSNTFDPMQVLTNVANKFKEHELCSYLIIANIASDDDIHKLASNVKHIVKCIVDKIEEMSLILENEDSDGIYRSDMNLKENETVHIINFEGWNLAELMFPLFTFSKSDELKYLVFNDYNMRTILNRIIYNGNACEQEYAFMLLYQLCFDDRIAKEIQDNKKLYYLITETKTKDCQGIVWVINNKFNQTAHQITKEIQIEDNKHIMISYNRESRDICLRIKNEIEKRGLKCWIDVHDMSGSTLEAMADAIEQASCVLICMTEKYKESPNCRLEAEYVVNIKKPFIPLILQKGYKPCGWLGIIIGSKIFIDFTKYDFQECIKRLGKEIETMTSRKLEINNKSETQTEIKSKTETNNYKPNNEALKWTQLQVSDWLSSKKFHPSIVKSLETSTGEILFGLYELQTKIPKFIFEKLFAESNSQLKLVDLVYFTFELEKLFKN